MSNQDPKIKKVIDTLAEGSRSVKNNPSEQNYREWEGKIEQAGKTSWTPYIVAGVVAIICICAFFALSGGAVVNTQAATQYSQISSVSIDHNVYENNQKGMRIHVDFNVVNKQNDTCEIAVYFRYQSGEILRDYNGSYTTYNGQVSVGETFIPQYYNTTYRDFTLFMPYDEFHIDALGEYDLEFQVELHEKSGELLAESSYYPFRLTNSP